MGRRTRTLGIVPVGLLCAWVMVLTGCSGSSAGTRSTTPHFKIGKPYQINGTWYRPEMVNQFEEVGTASWYGEAFHGKSTANGEVYNMHDITAAHRTLPLPSMVRVTNLENGRSIVVRVNDRGPFAKDRVIDLSKRAAWELGFYDQGTARVEVVYLGLAEMPQQHRLYRPSRERLASYDSYR
jgi:rare lipoprotein A